MEFAHCLNEEVVLFNNPIRKTQFRIAISDFVTISSFCDLFKVKMAAGKAQIGKLAPDFTAKAVMPDGQFHDLKLSDYRGTHAVVKRHSFTLLRARMNEAVIVFHTLSNADGLTVISLLWFRKICGLFLLPAGLHLCLPH